MEGFNIKNPLLQFFVVGALLFAANYFLSDNSERTIEILITQENMDDLRKDFYKTFGVYPDSTIMRSLLKTEIENEILFQKGLELGLDKNNEAMKNELIVTTKHFIMAQVDLSDPGDRILKDFMEVERLPSSFEENRAEILNQWRKARQLEYFDREMIELKNENKVRYELDVVVDESMEP